MEAARFAERFEDELIKWPRYRVKCVQDKLNEQYAKVARLEEQRADIWQRFNKTKELNQEITRINQVLEATASSITDQILPQTQKIISLKKTVAELYTRLGCSDLNAWYQTLMESNELENIEPLVTQMVRNQIVQAESRNTQEIAAKDEVSETSTTGCLKDMKASKKTLGRSTKRKTK